MFFKKISRQYYITAGITILIYSCNFLFSGFTVPDSSANQIPHADSGFTGSQACMPCHKTIYESHMKTAHYRTSALASAESIKGSFDSSSNHFRYNQFMEVVMEKKDDHFLQSAYISDAPYQSEEFDVVIGSGRKGQTYLYWRDSSLFQLPVSYYVPTHSWVNSPGYPTNMIHYSRPIHQQCIECHGTYAKASETETGFTVFDPNSIIYGVDCERCHGPGAKHVAFQSANPNEKKAFYIINAKNLSRQQRMDACALCHSGFRTPLKPAFTFAVGDKLEDFSQPNYNADSANWLDVHGNQYGLLVASQCYLKSRNMDCSSCHNVHKEEIANAPLYSNRCMNCHDGKSLTSCKNPKVLAMHLTDNCIDCHMPLLASRKISLETGEGKPPLADLVRTHRVAIYPDKTKAYLKSLQRN